MYFLKNTVTEGSKKSKQQVAVYPNRSLNTLLQYTGSSKKMDGI